MKQKILTGVAIVVAIIALYANITNQLAYRRLENENQELQVRLAHASIPFRTDTTRDTVQVFTQQVVEVERADFVREHLADKQLIKELQLRASQLECVEQMGTVARDTIRIYIPPDSVFRYRDQWTTIDVNIPDSFLTYSVRDSTQIIVAHEYKHRFLWWRWGVKGYKVKVVNFNPHTTILYHSYVKAK